MNDIFYFFEHISSQTRFFILVGGLSLGEYSIPMTQELLNEAVAEVTGEDIQTIDWLSINC